MSEYERKVVARAGAEFDPDDPLMRAMADLICPLDEGYRDDDGDAQATPIGSEPEAVLAGQLRSLESRIARLQAEKARVIALLDEHDLSTQRWVHETVAVALTLSPAQASGVVQRARTLSDDLPSTLAACARGELCERKARLVIEAAWRLPCELRSAFESQVLRRASVQTTSQLAQSIRRALIRLDPAAAEQRRLRARADRGVFCTQLDDGLAELRLVHTADTIAHLRVRLDAARSLLPSADDRTADQQRADLCVDALLSSLVDEVLPRRRGRRPSVNVVVQASTLLGANDEPAHLDGYGPITASMAREIACDPTGTWRRLLTDPNTGHLLDAGTDTYRPSPHLINFLNARDGGCSFPTCNAPPQRCEIEHCIPFGASGGKTAPDNTALACRRHNEIKKTDAPWRYEINADQTTTWSHRTSGLVMQNRPAEKWHTPDDRPPF